MELAKAGPRCECECFDGQKETTSCNREMQLVVAPLHLLRVRIAPAARNLREIVRSFVRSSALVRKDPARAGASEESTRVRPVALQPIHSLGFSASSHKTHGFREMLAGAKPNSSTLLRRLSLDRTWCVLSIVRSRPFKRSFSSFVLCV